MRRFLLAVVAALSLPLFSAGSLALPLERHLNLDDADRAELDAISAAMNAVTTLKGQFFQIEPNGNVDNGHFFIEKPGKVRFEYDPPVPTLLVSDGHTVAVANTRLNTVDRMSISDTPLKMILSNTVDIRHDQLLLGIEHRPNALVLKLRTSLNRSKPNLALVFSEPDHALTQWTVLDDQGLTTTVSLQGMQGGTPLDPALFALPQKKPAKSGN